MLLPLLLLARPQDYLDGGKPFDVKLLSQCHVAFLRGINLGQGYALGFQGLGCFCIFRFQPFAVTTPALAQKSQS